MIEIKSIIENFINPKKAETVKKDKEQNLIDDVRQSNIIKEYIKTRHWQEYRRDKIVNEIELSLGTLIRDGLTMGEVDIKTHLARIRAYYSEIEDMRGIVDKGDIANQALLQIKR